MVLLNEKEFPLYGVDTQESRFNRIAWILRTLPIFVAVQPADLLDLDPATNIVAEDLLKLIREDIESGNIDFENFYNKIKDRFKTEFEIILYTWVKQIPNFDDYKETVILDIESKFPMVKVDRILEHDEYDQSENTRIFLKSQETIERELKEFNTVLPVEMDNIDIKWITFEVEFTVTFDLVEIFDRLKMSPELPYANNGSDRHKIYKGFRNIGENWELGDPSSVQFYVLNTKFVPNKFNEKNYSQGVIVKASEEGRAIMAIETLIGEKNNLDELIDRVFKSLQVDKKNILQIRQQSVSSVVNFPRQRFNKYIMNDVLTIDPLIGGLCFVDESIRIGRVKSGITFFYQPVGSIDRVTITLTEAPVDLKLYRKNSVMYPIDSRYIRVRINKARDEMATREIALFVGKIMSIYNRHHVQIANTYTQFIPTFVELEEHEVRLATRKTNRLQDILPNMFIPGYARKCQKPPVIISDKVPPQPAGKFLLENPTPEYKQAILFPKTTEEGTQHWYACEKGMFPGLRLNVLSNASQYPYLPCCYPRPQNDKKNFKNYYLDFDIRDTSTSFSHILKTPKILSKGEMGTIPGNLEALFQSFSAEKTDFFRVGVARTIASFVEAVATALGRGVNRAGVTDSMFAACRQNAYDSTVESLKREFNANNEYLRPSLYIRAVEEYYRCNIYLFSREENNLGAIIYPRHRHSFLRYKLDTTRPAVIILEHIGSESDAAQFPQCEMIIATREGQKITNFTGDFAQKLDLIFKNTVSYYAGLSQMDDIDQKSLPPNITGQGIDSFGKTRTLIVKHDGTELFLITDPLPPLVQPEKGSYRNNKPELIKSYISKNNLEVIEITPDKYIVRYGNMVIGIPYDVKTSSVLRQYNQNQRTARYLQEYAYYLYSLYAKENGVNPNNINIFLRKNTVVKEKYEYPKIPRRFDLNGPYLDDKKLIVHSLEMAQRLGYSIELLMRRNPRKLLEYCSYEWIQEYYIDKNDFTADPDAVILMTEEALHDWIKDQSIEYPLYDVPSKDETIFHLKIGAQVYLIQKADSFENAVYISRVWNQENYNSKSVQVDEESGYMYYVFESPTEITIYGNSENKVLVWREGDELYYGSILDW